MSNTQVTQHALSLQRQPGDERGEFHVTLGYGLADRLTQTHWQGRLGIVRCLDLRHLLSTQHQRPAGGFRYEMDCTIDIKISACRNSPSSRA
jgi:hypothetical protein